jgi:hypothetical protein
MIEIAGPEQIRQDELVRQFLSATRDARKLITDPKARYYGIEVNDQSLVPGHNPRLGSTHFCILPSAFPAEPLGSLGGASG